jgi:hypothetical protein
MSELFSKVTNYVKTLSTVFLILETVLGLLVGGIIGALLDNPTSPSFLTVSLIFSLPLFLVLLIVKAFTQANFPTAAMEELKSRSELESIKKDVARKRTVDGYIDTAIESLNLQTCSLTQEGIDELCEKDIEDGLRSVIGPLIELPNYILDCSGSDFTVGAYLRYSVVPPAENNSGELDWIENAFVMRDDLDLKQFFMPDLMVNIDATGIQFELRNALQWTYNHNRFFTDTFHYEGHDYTIVASVPQVCEGNLPIGVLFITAEKLCTLPEGLDRTLLIFNRILANWLSKYNDCNQNKLQARLANTQDAA